MKKLLVSEDQTLLESQLELKGSFGYFLVLPHCSKSARAWYMSHVKTTVWEGNYVSWLVLNVRRQDLMLQKILPVSGTRLLILQVEKLKFPSQFWWGLEHSSDLFLTLLSSTCMPGDNALLGSKTKLFLITLYPSPGHSVNMKGPSRICFWTEVLFAKWYRKPGRSGSYYEQCGSCVTDMAWCLLPA